MSTPCPDCAGSGYQPGEQVECLRCDGYGRLRLTQREMDFEFQSLKRAYAFQKTARKYSGHCRLCGRS